MKIGKIILMCLCLLGFQANANLIEINLDKTELAPNDILNVTLLANFTDSIDGFDFDFVFDTNIFSFVDDSEDTDIPNAGFFSIFAVAANSTGLGIGYLDFFDSINGEYYISFALEALTAGTSTFDLEVNLLENSFLGVNYTLDDVDSKTASVPAPGALSILFIALVAMTRVKRRN
ncbi:hypothetical protein [Paraglaciecola sp. 2405UD69-4]|uniref:hypothetical protein n=1 Tax=Paraglaciecola sp. 2405UD69-4 TaxID=3391836 RepID=UPI0039C92048